MANWFMDLWHGLNLRGNTIKNAVVDTPQIDTDISNKKYVDDQQMMDTALAQQRVDSDRFPDVTDIPTKTIKEVLDDVLFPVIVPDYFNPTIIKEKVTQSNSIDNVIYGKNTTNFIFSCDFSSINDRLPLSIGKIKVKYTSASGLGTIEFSSTTTFNTYDNINFTIIDIGEVDTITYERNYGAATGKVDNYGNINIPSEFSSTYTLIHSIYIFELFPLILPPVAMLTNADNTTINTVISGINTLDNTSSYNTEITDLNSSIIYGNEYSFNGTNLSDTILLFVPQQTIGNWKIIFNENNENDIIADIISSTVQFKNEPYIVYQILLGNDVKNTIESIWVYLK